MRSFGNGEAVIGGRSRVALILSLLEGLAVVFVPDVREPLEEEQREDVLLVIAGIDEPTQQRGCAPEVGLELLLSKV